jgi:GNAT superfamily N-acetyltransferase
MSAAGTLAVRELSVDGDSVRARLSLDGREKDVHYRLGGLVPAQPLEALAVALLPIAMSRGWTLELPGGLSPRLREGLDSAQAILAGWWESWRRVELRADGAPTDPPRDPGRGVACFFTGGVDSFHSVLEELGGLDAAIFVHGFDVRLDDAPKRALVGDSLRAAAGELGIELIEVETNIKDLTWPECKWGFHAHGAALGSVAILAGSRFARVLLPSTHSYRDLYPWGSHLLLDRLWSTEAVELVHHEPGLRTRKVARLAESETALRHLRCCFAETPPGRLNCGHCEKCLRTMASLRIVGALGRCDTLPRTLSLREIRRMPVLGRGWGTLVDYLIADAEGAGDAELASALRTARRRGPRRARVLRARQDVRNTTRRSARRSRRQLRRAWRRARQRVLSGRGGGRSAPDPGFDIRPAVLPDEREAMLRVLAPEGLDRIPSAEMSDFDVGRWFVARRDGAVVGVAGFDVYADGGEVVGKNLLMAVREKDRGRGIGRALVDHRLRLMLDAGVTRVVTNTDRPGLIAWLVRDYGYRKVGEVPKLHEFGLPDVDAWTTLEAPMHRAAAGMDGAARELGSER